MKDKKPKKEVPQLDISFIIEDDWRELISEWISYRKEIKKPCTQRIVNSSYSMLKRLSGGDIEIAYLIVEQSETGGYQGLFPLKQDYGRKFNQTGSDKQQQYQEQFVSTLQRKMGEGNN